jgi:hypothetical protein
MWGYGVGPPADINPHLGLQPMAITTRLVGALVDPGVYGSALGASTPLNPPVQQGVNHSPSSVPSREVHKRSTAGTSQVSERPTRQPAGTRFISGRSLHSAAHPQTRQAWPAAWRGQSKAIPRSRQRSRDRPWIPWAMRGPDFDPPVIFREPGGFFTKDGGPSKSRNQRFGEPPASASPPRAIPPKCATGPGP